MNDGKIKRMKKSGELENDKAAGRKDGLMKERKMERWRKRGRWKEESELEEKKRW